MRLLVFAAARVARFGPGSWQKILTAYRRELRDRDNIGLKDRYRVLKQVFHWRGLRDLQQHVILRNPDSVSRGVIPPSWLVQPREDEEGGP